MDTVTAMGKTPLRTRSRRGGRQRSEPIPIARYALVAFGTLALLWLSVAVSLAGIARERRPDVVLRFWPWDGLAKAKLSEREITTGQDRQHIERARALAGEAIVAEPTSARAARMLGLTSRDEASARRAFQYSRQLSRRDLPTTLWFIEDAVRRDDARAALRQYEIALRTSSSAPILLFPVLDASLAQPQLSEPLANLLATGSAEWVPQFIEYSISGRTNAGHLGRVLLRSPRALMRLPQADRADLVRQLVEQRHFDVAAGIHRSLAGRSPNPTLVRHGGFDATGDWPPFDWALATTADYGANIQEGVLQAVAQGALDGSVARQLINLAPGTYRLRTTATLAQGSAGSSAFWAITCADPVGDIATLPVRAVSGRAAISEIRFQVASGCHWQWLRLDVRASPDGTRSELLVDEVSVTRF